MSFPGAAFQVFGGIKNGSVDVSVSQGFVNGYEPIVGGKKISGLNDLGVYVGAPRVKGNEGFDRYGRVYVSIRVKVKVFPGEIGDDTNGKMNIPPTEEDLSIVVTTIRDKTQQPIEKGIWYHPIAVITKDGELGQIAYFSYNHFVSDMPGSRKNNAFSDEEGKLSYGAPYPQHFFCIA